MFEFGFNWLDLLCLVLSVCLGLMLDFVCLRVVGGWVDWGVLGWILGGSLLLWVSLFVTICTRFRVHFADGLCFLSWLRD